MLKLLRAHNFKTFLNTEIRFGRQHLVIGKNNSGKTNLARLLQFLASTSVLEIDKAANGIPGGTAELCNWYLKTGQIEVSCVCSLELDGVSYDYSYELHLERSGNNAPAMDSPQLRIIKERLSLSGGDLNDFSLISSNGREALILIQEPESSTNDAQKPTTIPAPVNATVLSKVYDLQSNSRIIAFRKYLADWRYFSFSPFWMRYGSSDHWRNASAQQAPAPVIPWTACDSFGENLASAIYHLNNFDERRYRRLIDHVQGVEPSLEAINFLPVPGRQPIPFIDLEGRSQASWDGLSDGTLRALGLALIIETAAASSPPNTPGSCLSVIEEPENGIFPGLLRHFFDLFEDWAPTAQFIFTSHSPYLIDMFDDKRENVTVLRKAKDRSESIIPPKETINNGQDRLNLSMQYASELFS